MELAAGAIVVAGSIEANGNDASGLPEDSLKSSNSLNPSVSVVDTSIGNDSEVDIDANVDNFFTKDESANVVIDKFGDEEDTDEDDDTVNVIIKPSKGSIYKTGTTYQARSQQAGAQGQKALRPGININDPGSIQGVPTIEFNISSLGEDDKPWKRPGADITDYFNYGFTEDTWLQYCEKQKIIRQEYANTALKPVLVGAAAGFGLTNLSSASHRGVMRFPQQQQQQNKDIHVLSGRGRSPSVSDEELEKKNGLLGPGQAFNIPPPCFAPPTGGDALSQFGNVANALNFPPPGFTNTSVPPPLLGSGFGSQQPGHQWPQSNIGSGLLPLFPGQSVRSTGGRNHHSDNRRDRSPENQLYHEESSRDYGRHGERSSRRRGSRERRRDRSRERSRERDYSLVPSVSTNSGVPGGATTGSVSEAGASRSTRSGESRRRSERESHRSHHRHRRTSRHRSPSCQTSRPEPTESLNSQLSTVPSQPIDPLEAASAAAADISEKIRRASAGDGVSG
ncbi:Pre-mRNA 3'-end-processing factor FIP1 [Echinococcus granulosus]|uniref:Pre-mRNA 3'-end-processing factor FIP1 n=1 Tax=Echinococcus granulosus TaxID=6210 RepID=W6VE25_ECHGR|nr:Pre-mRNA 3'-end-processing factor FIP1 [Echinococcus granulosus]EUB65059.1 Pre-mRNA 3'-end-processing factor FIP1 [Echinococcus granulosus]